MTPPARSLGEEWRLEIAEDGFDLEILQQALEATAVLVSVSGLLEAAERRVGISRGVVEVHLTGADA